MAKPVALAANNLARRLVGVTLWARRNETCRTPPGQRKVDAAAGPGRCSCARLYGPEDDRDRDADQETTVGANDTNRHSRDWRRTTHRSPVEFDGTTRQRRRRRCRYCAHPRTSLARSMSGHRGGSRRMSARFVTVWSDGRADTARRCVPKRRCRASVIRRGSAEHPTENSRRPCAESDLGMRDRSVVVQGAARGGASIELIRRDASDRHARHENRTTCPSHC